MKTDDFEQRLQRQPQREIPAAWREEVLAKAKESAASAHATRNTQHGFRSLIHHLSASFRPQRAAWAGLAAAWVAIIALNIAARDNSANVAARHVAPPSPEAIAAWREQRRELAGLTETSQPRATETPKTNLPQPRSNRREDLFNA